MSGLYETESELRAQHIRENVAVVSFRSVRLTDGKLMLPVFFGSLCIDFYSISSEKERKSKAKVQVGLCVAD